jgi:hypothetical protein
LWDPNRRLLRISNEDAAQHFTNILLNGISKRAESKPEESLKPEASGNGFSRKH